MQKDSQLSKKKDKLQIHKALHESCTKSIIFDLSNSEQTMQNFDRKSLMHY